MSHTDFNDLAVSQGLNAVSEQIAKQVKAAVEQAMSPIDGTKLQVVLNDFCQIIDNGRMTNKFYDTKTRIEYGKTDFENKVGKDIAKAWYKHDHRTIERQEVKEHKQEALDNSIWGMLERYMVIFGTKEIWDSVERQRYHSDAIRLAHPNDFDHWLKSPSRKTIKPKNIWFDPSQKRRPDDEDELWVNSYRGMAIEPLDISIAEAREVSKPILNLLLHLCENNEDVFLWVLRWLAIPLQRPGTKMKTALIFHGEVQGAGKSLFFDDVMRSIYGEYSTTLGQADLEEQYNDWLDGNTYIVFEEVFSGTHHRKLSGPVKKMITESTVRINKKYSSGWQIQNLSNFVFLSNDLIPQFLEKNDRRMVVCCPKAKIPAPLKEKVGAAVNDPEKHMIRAFYQVLMTLNLGEQTENTEAIMTPSKEKVITLCLTSYQKFFQEWSLGNLSVPFVSCTSQDLYRAYIRWCSLTGEKSRSLTMLMTYIAKQEPLVSGHGRHWYKFIAHQPRMKATCIIIGKPDTQTMTQELWLGGQIQEFRNALMHDATIDDAPKKTDPYNVDNVWYD